MISDQWASVQRERNPDVGLINGIPERTMAAAASQSGHGFLRDRDVA